jgi:hypothetical protein
MWTLTPQVLDCLPNGQDCVVVTCGGLGMDASANRRAVSLLLLHVLDLLPRGRFADVTAVREAAADEAMARRAPGAEGLGTAAAGAMAALRAAAEAAAAAPRLQQPPAPRTLTREALVVALGLAVVVAGEEVEKRAMVAARPLVRAPQGPAVRPEGKVKALMDSLLKGLTSQERRTRSDHL